MDPLAHQQLLDLLEEELAPDELRLLVLSSFPALTATLSAARRPAQALVEDLDARQQLGRLLDVLYRERPDRGDDLAEIEALLSPEPEPEQEPAPAPPPATETLEHAVRTGALTRNEVISVVLALADQLIAVHLRGAAHGAVHPGNVLLDAERAPVLTRQAPSPPFFTAYEAQVGSSSLRIDVHSLARVAIFGLYQAPIPASAAHDIARFVKKLSVARAIRRVLVRAAGPLEDGYADMETFRDHLRAARAGDADLLLIDTPRPMRLVRVPGGSSTLGGEPLPGVHGRVGAVWKPSVVEVDGFWLADAPVTQAQWEAVVGERYPNPSHHREPDAPVERVQWIEAIRFLNALSKREGRRPAYRIHRGDEVEWFTDRDGYRLPTEAEWEHACRAGSRSRYPTGDDEAAMDRAGWYTGNTGGAGTMPVRWKAPGALGLYDMHGNVGEWCWDAWSDHPIPRPPATTQTKKTGARAYRGGGWVLSAALCAAGCRCRAQIDNKTRHDYIGFRVAQSLGT